MDFLLDPNIAYLFLLGGILLGLIALVNPGTGFFEVGAFFCLALAGYAVYNLSFNWWALIILVLSIVPFIYAIRKPKRELFLGLSILLLVTGSVFLFSVDGWRPAVNPLFALVASGSMAAFLWIAVRKAVQAVNAPPSHDLQALVGLTGEARTKIRDEGSVYVAGEMWSAKSSDNKPISAGSPIRVVRREGFVLVVEKINS
ncbi:MAG: NfeD family protein [Anaerolineales bacterium]|nr:NfeD family protein [Anaerolineales bacterium]